MIFDQIEQEQLTWLRLGNIRSLHSLSKPLQMKYLKKNKRKNIRRKNRTIQTVTKNCNPLVCHLLQHICSRTKKFKYHDNEFSRRNYFVNTNTRSPKLADQPVKELYSSHPRCHPSLGCPSLSTLNPGVPHPGVPLPIK